MQLYWILLLVLPEVILAETEQSSQASTESVGPHGPWTEWSDCGKSCGFGTQYRLRQCHRHESCDGPSKQFKICKDRPCPPRVVDYRRRECSKHNHIRYGKRTYSWIPYINEASPCQLSCKSIGFGYYARFRKSVKDGVTCNKEDTAMCMGGTCLSAGCDEILGSGSTEDMCGVCNGDGNTCNLISGIFTRRTLVHRGYSLVTTIPAGARNINITEIGESKNFLALATPNRGYFLNGHLRLQAQGEVQGAGTAFTYSRRAGTHCPGECLSAPGPTTTAIRVELLYFGRNSGIKYHYYVPRGHTQKEDQQTESSSDDPRRQVQVNTSPLYIRKANFRSDYAPLSADSRDARRSSQVAAQQRNPLLLRDIIPSQVDDSARSRTQASALPQEQRVIPDRSRGGGSSGSNKIQYKHYYHTNALDGIGDTPIKGRGKGHRGSGKGKSRKQVNNSVLVDSPQIPSVQDSDTNTAATPHRQRNKSYNSRIASPSNGQNNGVFSWRISGFTECSQPCGGGLQDTRVVCIKADSQVEVMEANCDVSIKPNTTTVVCNNDPCKASWHLGVWSVCSVTCGRGLQKREVECKQRISPTLTITVHTTTCPAPRPQPRQYCQKDPCFKWKTSDWTKCSTVCGFGQRTRTLTCVDVTGSEVDPDMCMQVRPITEEICDKGSCAQGWFQSKWTKKCSVECGRGHYRREVYCSASDGTYLADDKCQAKSKKPRENKSCKAKKPCGGEWFAGPWSKCNSTCGDDSYRSRDVFCIKKHGGRVKGIVKDHNCDKSDMPSSKKQCNELPDCKPRWFMMPWSKCSKSCDTGIRTREVKCVDSTFQLSPDCNKARKPSRRQSCNTHSCNPNYVAFSGISNGETIQVLVKDGKIEEQPACEDMSSAKWCRMVSQARLCGYYKEKCCRSCQAYG